MRMQISLIGYEVPSQNVTMRRHWRVNHKERTMLERWIRARAGVRTASPHLHIHSVRKQRITDNANLRGGCKTLVDAIVAAGLITDDKDSAVTITYSQATRGSAAAKVRTVVTVSDSPITENDHDIS